MKKTILLVDDEIAIVEVLSGILEDEGYQVVCALGGREGLSKLDEVRPAVVILDLMMPVLDGRETLEALRALPAHRDLPVLLISAAALPAEIVLGARTKYLRKPFDVDDMLATLAQLTAGPASGHP